MYLNESKALEYRSVKPEHAGVLKTEFACQICKGQHDLDAWISFSGTQLQVLVIQCSTEAT
jgi:hypothetical protein